MEGKQADSLGEKTMPAGRGMRELSGVPFLLRDPKFGLLSKQGLLEGVCGKTEGPCYLGKLSHTPLLLGVHVGASLEPSS